MKKARVAGALYVLMGVLAPICIIYIPGRLIVRGDAAATAGRILESPMLFRLGIVGELITAAIFVFLVFALYRLLCGVNRSQVRLMVGLVLVSVAISFVTVLNNIAALILFQGTDYLAVFDKPQQDALGMLFIGLHGQGHFVNEMFWGLWLFPFGWLVYRSGFLPRILGILLIANGIAYVAASLTWLLAPEYGGVVNQYAMPAMLGEIWIMLWLLIRGINVHALARQPSGNSP